MGKGHTKKEKQMLKKERIGTIKLNINNEKMICIQYNNNRDIIVEFQDEYKSRIHTNWDAFENGSVKNPYYPSVFGVGITGDKYPCKINNVYTKEYRAWQNMLSRCYKKVYETYDDVTCCKEWLLFENFYEWLHGQENFNKWINGDFAVDKDILIKGNRTYSPETCCLVPHDINVLFIKRKKARGDLPIGVCFENYTKKYLAHCNGGSRNKGINLGRYNTPEEAFYAYKRYKEKLIKKIAQDEYTKGNITKQCYKAMMNYEVEITD